MLLRCGKFEFTFPRPALLMGIVNVTPDSFSDGGKFIQGDAAVALALKLVEEGADIIDVGGESTRPRATPVDEKEELRRVMPVITHLAERLSVPISIDTMKPSVAGAAISAGASLVNDVAANREDQEMWRVVAETGAGYVVMHMQGTPQTMQERPGYRDVAGEVEQFFFERLERLSRCGVGRERTILDPGIGFGKTREHNLRLLGALPKFEKLERPMLLGVSRKSFLARSPEDPPAARLPAALACASYAVGAGVQIIRTHDVADTARAVRMAEEIKKRQELCEGR
jgi:dihydropteroate synthase